MFNKMIAARAKGGDKIWINYHAKGEIENGI